MLDWELAHLGYPMEYLGWVCVNSLFSEVDTPVGGFGSREKLFGGYAAAGRRVAPVRMTSWEVMGTLLWGLLCGCRMQRSRESPDSMERAMTDVVQGSR